MLANKNPSGSPDGTDNLLTEHFRDHAYYLATALSLDVDKDGIAKDDIAFRITGPIVWS